MMRHFRVQLEPFDVGVEHGRLGGTGPATGAVALFVGQVRDHPLILETWPAMAERQLALLADQAAARWPLLGVVIVHRHGELGVGEAIVLAGAASAHRHAAQEAVAFLMDRLKTEAPFWKRGPSGQWVEARAADEAAAQRWGA